MRRIVITGGPCSGKTSCLKAVQEQLGDYVDIVPEVATIIWQGGFPRPSVPTAQWPHEYRRLLQKAVLDLQQSIEEACQLLAQQAKKTVLICDRGAIDGAAYWPDGLKAYLKHFNLCFDTICARYDAVVHLESLATATPDYYSDANNQHRYESLAEAQMQEDATCRAWHKHPLRLFIPGNQPLDSKIQQVLMLIRSFL